MRQKDNKIERWEVDKWHREKWTERWIKRKDEETLGLLCSFLSFSLSFVLSFFHSFFIYFFLSFPHSLSSSLSLSLLISLFTFFSDCACLSLSLSLCIPLCLSFYPCGLTALRSKVCWQTGPKIPENGLKAITFPSKGPLPPTSFTCDSETFFLLGSGSSAADTTLES